MSAEVIDPPAGEVQADVFEPVTLDAKPLELKVKIEADPIPKKLGTGPTDEALSAYDAETVRLVMEAERRCQDADREYENLKADASDAKKRAEATTDALRKLICDRAEDRGKPPERTLLDMATPAPNAGEWRSRDLSHLALMNDTRRAIESFGVATLGELYDEVHAGQDFGLTLGIVSDIRHELENVLNAESARVAAAVDLVADPELWRQYPIAEWRRFGLTAKDVEKLAAGEVKRETGRRPVVTVGDLSDFTAPTPTGYSRGYADVKGIGPGGADRISEAETKFWQWWRDKGEVEFARERGLIRGAEAVAGTDGCVPEVGVHDGADGFDTDGPQIDPAFTEADAEARNNVDTPGEVYADFSRR